ncbi:hypothetical protein MA47_01800 [Corynebacterium auriscanis]|uniref:Uncharacterized protein n=1 Tax=Corynebacterium auriscanis TaxID=99807 RepID=A0A0A2DM82_9CORY|nr:hypothetical protein MA47_01800 [Corynebacterium auriscanis]
MEVLGLSGIGVGWCVVVGWWWVGFLVWTPWGCCVGLVGVVCGWLLGVDALGLVLVGVWWWVGLLVWTLWCCVLLVGVVCCGVLVV